MAVVDGSIDDAGLGRLAELLRGDAAAQRLYVDYLMLDAELVNDQRVIEPCEALPVAGQEPGPIRAWWPLRLGMGLAAVIALVGIIAWFESAEPHGAQSPPPVAIDAPEPSDSEPIATLTHIDGQVMSETPLEPGQRLTRRTIRTRSGSTGLQLASGAQVMLVGHSEMRLDTPMRVTMTRGAATFNCPPEARGFTIDLPGGVRVVDLGTRFGVKVSPDGRRIEAWVDEGMIELRTAGGRPRQLTAGQVVSLEDQRTSEPLLIEADASSGRRYEIVRGGFTSGSRAYTDRTYEWIDVESPAAPDALRGADYVRTANQDKTERDLRVRLRLSGPADVYVLWNPNAPLPGWLVERFEHMPGSVTLDTDHELSRSEPTLAYSVWRRHVPRAGVVMLGPRALAGVPSDAGMYGIVVTEPPASVPKVQEHP